MPPDAREEALDCAEVSDYLYRAGRTDGLPVIPPTRGRVEAMLRGTALARDRVVAVLGPRRGLATVEKVAINAVMAGCEPGHISVVLAATEAVGTGDYWEEKREFILSGVVSTANNCAVATIVSGRLAARLGVHAGQGCMGPGFKANATIGRAVQFVLRNIGGAVPGETDFSVVGQPGKFTLCFAENDEALPAGWTPLRVERWFPAEATAATVIAVEPAYHVHDQLSRTAQELCLMFAKALARPAYVNQGYPGEVLVILAPEHAARFAKDGWVKRDIQAFIHEVARVPVDLLADEFVRVPGGVEILRGRGPLEFREWPKWAMRGGAVPITRGPEDVVVVVAGGAGTLSMVACTWSHSLSVTRAVDRYLPDDPPAA